ncbi:hypothetical protein Airi02_054070 [Actinoallomurus iriomotensis]|uniref:Uncharacterized protein n=1 Tax=Actinoallomurus iriomotensis TaxID=478107 RepID=A0A9W6S5G0_9ACTN|nr:hypothetical protein Airi02_054070 [Actinoallomurus iriomotensis]
MRELGLRAWRPLTTDADPHHRIPDLVERDFTATAPATKFVGDIKARKIRSGDRVSVLCGARASGARRRAASV